MAGQQQIAKLQQPRGIRRRLARQVDAHEIAQRLAVVDRIFQRLVGQAVPLLQQVHAQHLGHTHRLAAHPPARRMQRLDHRDQLRPRHNALHLAQETSRGAFASSSRRIQHWHNCVGSWSAWLLS